MLSLVKLSHSYALKLSKGAHTRSGIASFFSTGAPGDATILNGENVSSTKIEVNWKCGTSRQYLTTWLRDHDPIGNHPESKQRQSNTLEIVSSDPRPSKPLRAWIENENEETLKVEWASPLVLSGGIVTPTTTSFTKKFLFDKHGSISSRSPASSADNKNCAVGSTTLGHSSTPR